MDFVNQLISAAHRYWEIVRRRRPTINFFRRYWQDIRNHKVAEEALRAKIPIAWLTEDRKRLIEQRGVQEQEIAYLHTPEIVARYKLRRSNAWLCASALLALASLGSAYWVVIHMGGQWWQQAVMVAAFLSPAICIALHIHTSKKNLTQVDFARHLQMLTLVAVLAAAVGTGALHMARGIPNTQIQSAPVNEGGDEVIALEEERQKKTERKMLIFDDLVIVGLFLLGIAAEMGAALAYHEASENRYGAKETLKAYAQHRETVAALVQNSADIEAAKQRPGILFHRLTVEGLEQEAEAARLEEARQQEQARRVESEAKRKLLKSERNADLGWRMRKVSFIFLAAVLILGMLIAAAFAATGVIGIDRTTSAGVRDQFEFSENINAAGNVLRNFSGAGDRAVVLSIGEQSFAAPVILDRQAPTEVGRFGERLSRERLEMRKEWEIKKKMLKPTEQGSDMFGFFARASLIFKDQTNGTKQLIALSDMRQVGRGYNFERSIDDPVALLQKVKREDLIPDLSGVQVWVLGAHTAGIDERLWRRLRDFWNEYTKISGAELKAFSPDRAALREITLK